MERNYLRPDSFVELDFLAEEHMGIHTHSDIELLFVISGTVAVRVEENIYRLDQGGMLLVNVNRNHSYSGSPDLVMGRFLISYNKIREFLKKGEVLFWCNTADDMNSAYDDLRKIICRIFNQYVSQSETNSLALYSLYYQMLNLLAENFLLSVDDRRMGAQESQEDDRLRQIFSYIRTNYSKNITLDDMAKELYLSPTYVSKYIRKHCGMRFTELLTAVRLSHAVEDLLYFDSSIMKIALDNGFASVAACNKAFKDAYQMTPSQFRRERSPGKHKLSPQEAEKKKRIEKSVDKYLDQYPQDTRKNDVERLPVIVKGDTPPVGLRNTSSLLMINAGSAADLMNVRLCRQIADRREMMGFTYVRFWDIYGPELYLDINAPYEEQNYSRLDIVTDFLVKHHLKPYIELGAKPVQIQSNPGKAVSYIRRDLEFLSDKHVERFYGGLARHFVSRYGEEEVLGWRFELWEKTKFGYKNFDNYQFKEMSEEDHRTYFAMFDHVAGAIRRVIPEAVIGGGGFPVRMYGEEGFGKILSMWKQESQIPDFISITSFPYSLEKDGNRYYEKRVTDMGFIRQNITMAKNALKAAGWENKELHVSEYSFSLSNRNVVNDSCIKGAFLVSHMISQDPEADLAGHWLFSDIYADARDTRTMLFGGCGLLSKDGIPKPSYYAFEFYNKLYDEVILKQNNIMITRGHKTDFRILCHNFKRFSYNYYITEEDQITVKDLPALLDDREFLTIKAEISHLEDGVYSIRKNRVNRKNGSVQDKWMALNMEAGLTMKEMEYLEKSSISEITITEEKVIGGCLSFEIVLEPNEIQYIDLRKKN